MSAVTVVRDGGKPVTNVAGARPAVAVHAGGNPVTLVSDGQPITLLNEGGTAWSSTAGITAVGGLVRSTTNTLTIPAGYGPPTGTQADLIIGFGFRFSNTGATLPADWVDVGLYLGITFSCRIGVKYAQSASEAFGTWTNSTRSAVRVLRLSRAPESPLSAIGPVVVGTGAQAARVINWGAVTGLVAGDWVVASAASSADTDITPRADLVNVSTASASFPRNTVGDSGGLVTTWDAAQTATGAVNTETMSVSFRVRALA